MQWFQDKELWQVIIEILGIIIAIILPIGLVLWERGKNRKRFVYWVESVSPLFPDDVMKLRQLEVLEKGQAVIDPYMTVISFYNMGRLPITPSDFVKPLTIETSAKTALSVVVTKTTPDDLEVRATPIDSEIRLTPLLLNSDDSFTIVIITEQESKPSIKVRLVDVARIEDLPSIMNYQAKRNSQFAISISFIMFLIILATNYLWPIFPEGTYWMFQLLLMLLSGVLIFYITRLFSDMPRALNTPKNSSRHQ